MALTDVMPQTRRVAACRLPGACLSCIQQQGSRELLLQSWAAAHILPGENGAVAHGYLTAKLCWDHKSRGSISLHDRHMVPWLPAAQHMNLGTHST